jgi:hypothetical protein
MSLTARELRNVCLAVAALLAACSSGRATGDASVTGTGGDAGNTGAGGAGPGDAGTIACGDAAACTTSELCLRTVIGGASYICPDAGSGGTCPAGAFLDTAGCCYGYELSTYSCAARPSGCGASVTCACAASTLCTNGTCSELGASDLACLRGGT